MQITCLCESGSFDEIVEFAQSGISGECLQVGEEVVLLGGHGDQSVSVERWAELEG